MVERDELYYDVLNLPDGRMTPLKVRSMVGLIPLFAIETIEPEMLEQLPESAGRLRWFLNHRPDLAKLVSSWNECGQCERHLLSLLLGDGELTAVGARGDFESLQAFRLVVELGITTVGEDRVAFNDGLRNRIAECVLVPDGLAIAASRVSLFSICSGTVRASRLLHCLCASPADSSAGLLVGFV